MRQVPSPTVTHRTHGRVQATWLRLLLVGALLLGLVAGSTAPASADSLQDQRAKVRKALAKTKASIATAQSEVKAASSSLEESETRLATARRELAYVQGKLAKAREKDANIAKALKKAEKALEKSEDAVAQGEADLAEQERLIGDVARTAYQRHSRLIDFSVMLDADNVAQVADRAQWTELIFSSSATEMERLQDLQLQLEAAKQAREAARADVAEQRRQSKAQVAAVKELANDAAAREAEVARLVAENRKLRDTAMHELEASREQYDKLEKQEASITKKILAQAAKDKHLKVNSKGFIRPVNANPGSPYGMRYHPILHYWRMHWGLDFGAKCGAPLYAMANGKVAQVLRTSQSNGLGNWTVINYGSYKGANMASGYAHQSRIVVRPGQSVKQGQVVGYVGTTGLSTGCHLHLQMYRNGTRVNPRPYV